MKLENSDITYKTNKWLRFKFESSLKKDGLLSDSVEKTTKNYGSWPYFSRELYSRLYSSVEKLEEPDSATGWAEKLHSFLDELPEFKDLEERCKGDDFLTRMSTVKISGMAADTLPEDKEQKKDIPSERADRDYLEDFVDSFGKGQEKLDSKEKSITEAEQEGKEISEALDKNGHIVRDRLRKAIIEVNKDINEFEETLEAFGFSENGQASLKESDPKKRVELFKKVKHDPRLKEIANLAGRFRRIAAQKQKEKVLHLSGEIDSVKLGNDLSRVLPHEFARLSNPVLKNLFLVDYVGRKLQQYELKSVETNTQGPIVVLLDESSSMNLIVSCNNPLVEKCSTTKEVWARAVFLGIMEVAHIQKRSCCLVQFNTKVCKTTMFDKGNYSPVDIMKSVETFYGGGTSYVDCFDSAFGIIHNQKEFKKADIILISDGIVSTSDVTYVKSQLEIIRKKIPVSVLGIYIPDTASRSYSLNNYKEICDKFVNLTTLAKQSASEKALVNAAFTI